MKSRYLRKSSIDAGYSSFGFKKIFAEKVLRSGHHEISFKSHDMATLSYYMCHVIWLIWCFRRQNFVEIDLKTFLMRHSLVLEQIVYTWYLRNHFHEHHGFPLHVKPPTIMDPGNWCLNIKLVYWKYRIIHFLSHHVTEIILPASGESFCIW